MWVADVQHPEFKGHRQYPFGAIPAGCFILAVRYIPAFTWNH